MGNTFLEADSEEKDLGVAVDDKLKFSLSILKSESIKQTTPLVSSV